MLLLRPAQAKSKIRTYLCIGKTKKTHLATKIENVSFVKPHPDYGYDKTPTNLSRIKKKISFWTRDRFMILMYCFIRRIGKNFQKQQMARPVSSNLFQTLLFQLQVLFVTTPMTSWPPALWNIVSNLNLHVNKFF